MYLPSLDILRNISADYKHTVLYKEINEDSLTPVSVLKKISQEENIFLLESANLDKTFSRYSFFCYNPQKIIKYIDGVLKVKDFCTNTESEKQVNKKNFIKFINEKISSENKIFNIDSFGDFKGGFVGFFGYESVNLMDILRKEVSVKGEISEDIVLFEVDQFFVIDNYKNKVFAAHTMIVSQKDELEDNYKATIENLDKMEKELLSLQTVSFKSDEDLVVNKEYEEDEFIEKVKQIKDEIINGECIQIVLSNKYEVNSRINPVSFYRTLRNINPSPYLFFFKFDDKVICGSSPETHLKVKDNKAVLKPIAGTYKLSDYDSLIECKEKLLVDTKENAEHLMLLDLARNDLYTSCDIDSVKVEKSFVPEVYSHLIHIVSEVSGVLKDNLSSFDLFCKTFPAGTVSGAPKVRAIELIDTYEKSKRGFYAGCIGYIGYDGNLDTCITIRSALLLKNKMVLRAGAGIVADSNPKSEFREIETKLQALLSALGNIKELESRINLK